MSDDLWAALCRSADRWPERPALIHGTRRTTFSEWHRRARDYAAWLRVKEADRGERILLWMEPSAEMAAALFGSWAAGCIPVLIDPRSQERQLRAAITTTAPWAVVHGAEKVADLSAAAEAPRMVHAKEVPTQRGLGEPAGPTSPEDPASIVFTSGSTSGPKGVVQSHGNLARGCLAVTDYLGTTVEDRIVCAIPWSFDYGFMQIQATALTGAAQIIPDGATPLHLCQTIERERPTVLPGIPSLFAYLLQRIWPFREIDRSSIRVFTNTGGTIPAAILGELLELLGQARCFLNYGLTESYRTSYLDPELVCERPTSIGRAIPGAEIAIIRDDGTAADPDEVGEIVHRGDFIFLRYWDNPEATARVRRPDPLAARAEPHPAPALFTGDLGRIDPDGFLYYEGRRDNLIKSMGVRVSPTEVEEILLASGLVNETAVFGVPHEVNGQEVCAAVVPRGPADETRKALIRYTRKEMSAHMIPRRYVMLTRMPRTISGKVDYPALRDAIPTNRP